MVLGYGKHFLERFLPALGLNLVVSVGLDQFIRRGWIIVTFECVVEVTKLFARVAVLLLVFSSTVTYLLSLSLRLASLFVVRLLVSALIVVCHPPP
ncbi:hypothetical protein M0R89_00710 [Halorussus limi]|uniref:Uncharacterized protein n=1 Tax=Halorussus limi TaxID=2938695 RepID=A0A8U0HU66_9EURY|nr:hypothetical protein [Halorussus limi]UPV74605.1 hypothetical protein M0R89_00710 [Halorussus limi]